MLTINQRNVFVRLAYLFSQPPALTDLCSLFWRCVGMALVLILAGLGVAFVVTQFYMYLLDTLAGIVVVVALLAVAVVFVTVVLANVDPTMRDDLPPSLRFVAVPRLMVLAVKGRYCPLIRIDGAR